MIICADALANALEAHREQAVLATVISQSNTFGISPALALAVIHTESNFHANAVSSAGAIGLMQLMPETFSYLVREFTKEELTEKDLYRAEVNIRYGCCYLAYLFKKFPIPETALAAYNAGEGRVSAWLSNPSLSDGTKLLTIPFPETEAYVSRVMQKTAEYQQKYHFKE